MPPFTQSIHKLLLVSLFLLKELLGKTQAEVAAAAAGRAAAPKRNTAVPRVAVPTATTAHAERARRRTLWVVLGGTTIIIVPVVAPLPYVATHVIQSQLIRFFLSNFVRFIFRVITILSHVTYYITSSVLVTLALVTPTGGIFPFCLGGQTEVSLSYLVQLTDKLLAVIP